MTYYTYLFLRLILQTCINIISFFLKVLALFAGKLLLLELEHFVGSAKFALVRFLKLFLILTLGFLFLLKPHESASQVLDGLV